LLLLTPLLLLLLLLLPYISHKQGDYPSLMRERCGDRLPRFTAEQRAMLVGSVDFFGLNHYSSHLCEQPAWYKELAPQQDEEEREGKLVRHLTLLLCYRSVTDVAQGF
jgi:hypothetical protein